MIPELNIAKMKLSNKKFSEHVAPDKIKLKLSIYKISIFCVTLFISLYFQLKKKKKMLNHFFFLHKLLLLKYL